MLMRYNSFQASRLTLKIKNLMHLTRFTQFFNLSPSERCCVSKLSSAVLAASLEIKTHCSNFVKWQIIRAYYSECCWHLLNNFSLPFNPFLFAFGVQHTIVAPTGQYFVLFFIKKKAKSILFPKKVFALVS